MGLVQLFYPCGFAETALLKVLLSSKLKQQPSFNRLMTLVNNLTVLVHSTNAEYLQKLLQMLLPRPCSISQHCLWVRMMRCKVFYHEHLWIVAAGFLTVHMTRPNQ